MLPIDRVIDVYIYIYIYICIKKSALVMVFQVEWEIMTRCGSSLVERSRSRGEESGGDAGVVKRSNR